MKAISDKQPKMNHHNQSLHCVKLYSISPNKKAIYICIHVYHVYYSIIITHSSMPTLVHAPMCTEMHAHTHAHTHTCTCTHTCTHARTHTHTHARTHTQSMPTLVHTPMCTQTDRQIVCVRVCAADRRTHTYTCTCMHTHTHTHMHMHAHTCTCAHTHTCTHTHTHTHTHTQHRCPVCFHPEVTLCG